MPRHFMDLSIPEYAYMLGFLQADGHLQGSDETKGQLTVELGVQDKPLLESFRDLFPCPVGMWERVRDTNFKRGSHTAVLAVSDQEARRILHANGVPYGKKSGSVSPPKGGFSASDYFRGVLDGDGSVGVTRRGFPFVSLSTTSASLALGFVVFLEPFLGYRKESTPNKRDGAYTVVVFKEDAQAVLKTLYYDGCLCLSRKKEKARQALGWERPPSMRRRSRRRKWTEEEDQVVLTLPVPEAASRLGRTEQSVATRLWRLGQKPRTKRAYYRTWTSEELKIIQRLPFREAAQRTGRTEASVQAKLCRLKKERLKKEDSA